MSRSARYAGLVLAFALAVVVGWQIIATRVSDWLAPTAPHRALAWDAHNPAALLVLAQQQLAARHPRLAAANARELLRTSPLQAEGIAVLARAAEMSGNAAAAQRLFPLALRRAPRDEYVRAWMIGTLLQDGDYTDALHNVDVLLGFAPQHQSALIPLLVQFAERTPAFATALGRYLATEPRWRNAMLDDLLAHAPLATVDRVFSTVQTNTNGLSDAEADHWYTRLEKEGRWGEAYSRWASHIDIGQDGSLPAVYNGNFAQAVTGTGFDWSMRGQPGVVVTRVRGSDTADAYAAEVTFRGRRADAIGFEQTLLLAPGSYRLTFRARSEDLRSDQGLAWDIDCVAGGQPIATSPRLEGSFGWKTVNVDFSVPATQCPAQRLTLVNPGASGSGKVVSGRLWFTDFRITPAD